MVFVFRNIYIEFLGLLVILNKSLDFFLFRFFISIGKVLFILYILCVLDEVFSMVFGIEVIFRNFILRMVLIIFVILDDRLG